MIELLSYFGLFGNFLFRLMNVSLVFRSRLLRSTIKIVITDKAPRTNVTENRRANAISNDTPNKLTRTTIHQRNLNTRSFIPTSIDFITLIKLLLWHE